MSAPSEQRTPRPAWQRVIAVVQVVAMAWVFIRVQGPAEVAYALREGELITLPLLLAPFLAMVPALLVLTTGRPRGLTIAWPLTWLSAALVLVGLFLLEGLAAAYQH